MIEGSLQTWGEIQDIAEESLSNSEHMTSENIQEVRDTYYLAQQRIREIVGQIALNGLSECITVWKKEEEL